MGRYYDGDINGKFWFGLQASDAADRFGSIGQVPDYLTYWFDEDHRQRLESELKSIEGEMGTQLELFNKFFENNTTYSDEKMAGAGLDLSLFSDYADYLLGKKILDCINEHGSCHFSAEL
jgi:hypothetical protein